MKLRWSVLLSLAVGLPAPFFALTAGLYAAAAALVAAPRTSPVAGAADGRQVGGAA